MEICTIGFTKKSLEQFVNMLRRAGVKTVIDVRLNNTSQLAGYAKKNDLAFVLSLVGIDYEHRPELAPTEELLQDYKKKKIQWEQYEERFLSIIETRQPVLNKQHNDSTICLLCSEENPSHCHRRLVAEYFEKTKEDVKIRHL